jgi:predicted Zn-dependent protease
MAKILVLRNDLRGALAHLIDAVLLDDRDMLVWRTIGETAAAIGDNHLARVAFETLVTRQPDNASALRSLMNVNRDLRDVRSAFEAAKRVSALEPHSLYQHRVTQNLHQQILSPPAQSSALSNRAGDQHVSCFGCEFDFSSEIMVATTPTSQIKT